MCIIKVFDDYEVFWIFLGALQISKLYHHCSSHSIKAQYLIFPSYLDSDSLWDSWPIMCIKEICINVDVDLILEALGSNLFFAKFHLFLQMAHTSQFKGLCSWRMKYFSSLLPTSSSLLPLLDSRSWLSSYSSRNWWNTSAISNNLSSFSLLLWGPSRIKYPPSLR